MYDTYRCGCDPTEGAGPSIGVLVLRKLSLTLIQRSVRRRLLFGRRTGPSQPPLLPTLIMVDGIHRSS